MNSNKKPSHSKKSAWDVALKLLAGRDFSRSEMEIRLAKRGFDEPEIQETIDKLLKYNYVVETGNDIVKLKEMANDYFAKKKVDAIEKKHLRSLEAFLVRKGFNVELVNEFLEILSENIENNNLQ